MTQGPNYYGQTISSSIFETARLMECPWSSVVSTSWQWSKEGQWSEDHRTWSICCQCLGAAGQFSRSDFGRTQRTNIHSVGVVIVLWFISVFISIKLCDSLLSGTSVWFRGQQHNHCGALRCMGKAQKFGHKFLLQQKFCFQWSLGVVIRTLYKKVWSVDLINLCNTIKQQCPRRNIKSVVCPNSNT